MAKRETAAAVKKASAAGEQSQNFESSLVALEKIVRELERGDLPLEKSLDLFEQGVRLSRECQERLNESERRIEILLRDSEGRPTLSAFDDDDDELGPSTDDESGKGPDDDESVF